MEFESDLCEFKIKNDPVCSYGRGDGWDEIQVCRWMRSGSENMADSMTSEKEYWPGGETMIRLIITNKEEEVGIR